MKTLFQRVFDGNDQMYALAVKAVDEAVAKLGADAPATFGDTAYSLPCLYAMTGKKVATVGEAKEALETTIKDFMTRNNRTKDIFTSGVATATVINPSRIVIPPGPSGPYACSVPASISRSRTATGHSPWKVQPG